MKKMMIIALLASLPSLQNAQNVLKGRVVNAQNNAPIPYSSIGLIKENRGISSDENGYFDIDYKDKNDTLLVSCVGFKTLYLTIKDVKNEIKLIPQVIQLQTVVVKPRKSKELILNEFKGRKWFPIDIVSFKNPTTFQLAQLFIHPQYGEWFLKEIKIKQQVFIPFIPKEPNIFKLRFYSVDAIGKPDIDIFESILMKNKGDKYLKIDLTDKKLVLPKNGLFIGIEWIKIKENEYCETFKEEKKKKTTYCHCAPRLGKFRADSSTMQTYYMFTPWTQKWVDANTWRKENFNEPFHNLGIELTITD